MKFFSVTTILVFVFLFSKSFAQQPVKPNSAEIFLQIQKLNFLGNVLYVAAHPDDENTRLITYLANDLKARTAYLSLTRGDGGQNLIGSELRELLGVIRTQELLEARKTDGGEQLFSRANDFGFSKNPTETLQIWDKNQVLADVIWQIRKFRPDVIINRFDHRTSGNTHGHHTASAILTVEAFDLANNQTIFPEQLSYVKTWQPKRLFFNQSWWFYGSREKFDQADKSKLITLQIGSFYPLLGKSNQEIAALSRSKHKSQGFGSTGTRGSDLEYLELLKGDFTKNNIFEGIDTSWNRIEGGAEIGKILLNVEKKFNFKNPSQSLPELVKAYQLISTLKDDFWQKQKTTEIIKIIQACSGLFIEAVANAESNVAEKNVKLKLEIINRSEVNAELKNIVLLPDNKIINQQTILLNNVNKIINLDCMIPSKTEITQPYWLKNESTVGMYAVDKQEDIGVPDIIRVLKVVFNISINNIEIPFEKEVIFKENDEVKGEIYKPFNVVPDVTMGFNDKVFVFNSNEKKKVSVTVKSGVDDFMGVLHLNLASGWKVSENDVKINLPKKGDFQVIDFLISCSENAASFDAKLSVISNGKTFDLEQFTINYDHISKQQVFKKAIAKFLKIDIEACKEKIAYIMGAGDEVPKYLEQMGYEVSVLKPEQILPHNLNNFDVVITGIRAYNTVEALADKQKILFDFVAAGHTMIVQYNTNGDIVTQNLAPYPLKISNDRVTEENAEVNFLNPNHPLLNHPNKITKKDFEGWVQEQGLYYPQTTDDHFETIISSHDNGESSKNNAILKANFGKGVYIYTGLSFFRELPAGVTGAYRLFANLISCKQ
jgi:LmbE family N-acetylglucosaminyl deacetylase